MSTSLVRKSLSVVDPQFNVNSKKKRKNELFGLNSDNKKILAKTYKKGGKKDSKVNLLSKEKKLTVSEAKKTYKSKEQILKENLRKLELIKTASKVEIDEKTVKQIIERAVTRRPLTNTPAKEKDQGTVFTEEDFKKFEEEYFDE
ncbi:uncharacterized protein [Leptinotarsa decemlineata]|uniref:uncharacterized protein n=1 Tax=Leptinotarsa decemlineata TaxID=7539 RepID=UPI000C25530C|nr:active regulator of SIRT1-like [Leptinotarsa decemlineata]